MRILFHLGIRLFLKLLMGINALTPIKDEKSIVIANHNSHLDVFVLFSLFPLIRISKVRAVAAGDYFSAGFKGFGARYFFNALLIERKGGVSPAEALKPVEEALERGESLLIFPEGTRGEPGVLSPFKPGIGALMESFPDVPVYPVCLKGIAKTMPRDSYLPVPFSVKVNRLEPVYGRDMVAKYGSGERRAIAADLEQRVREGLETRKSELSLNS